MEKGNNKKTEDFLHTFSLKPAPETLKEKILHYSHRPHKSSETRAVAFRNGLAVCGVLLISVIAIDATITHFQNKRFSSIFQKGQESIDLTEEEHSLIREIIGEFSGSTKSGVNLKLYNQWEKREGKKRPTGWRESLEKEIE
jgi:hypothetical protein